MSVCNHSKDIFLKRNIYFITFTILGWKNIFTSDKYTELVYKWFDYQKLKYDNMIFAYTIMPNHFHGVFYLSEKSPNISKLIQNGKRFLAYGIVRLLEEEPNFELLEYFKSKAETKKNAKHKIFEDGFDCKIIYSENFLIQKINYIHTNPCSKKWNLCVYPQDYTHSSASNYINGSGKYQIDMIKFV
jgi:REP element-mobilizing transposase RayT